YLEHRRPIGFDTFMATFPASVTRGVLVHRADSCNPRTALLVIAGVTGTFGEIGPGESAFFDGDDPLVVGVESGDETEVTVCLRRCLLRSATVRSGNPARFAADGFVGLAAVDAADVSPAVPWSVRVANVEGGVPSAFEEATVPAVACRSTVGCAGKTPD